MPSYLDYSGAAMTFLQGFATSAYNTAQAAIVTLTSVAVQAPISLPVIPAPPVISPAVAPELAVDIPASQTLPDAPAITIPTIPVMSAYTLPTLPTLHDIVIPDFVAGDMPELSATLPSVDFSAPDIPAISTEEAAQDSLFGRIRDKLETNIRDGGTMLNPQVEADIWQRDLERHEQELQDAIDKATGQWAKLGFTAPDGLLAGAMLALNTAYMDKKLDRSREIAVKQAELEQTGMFKSLELGVHFETMVMANMNEFAKRRVEVAKANGDILISIFKEKVNLYNVNLEKFKTDALVYKTKLEAELSRVEVFKTQVQALVAITQVDETRIKSYAAQIQGISQLVEIYNTQVKGVAILYEFEKGKIDLFKGQIEAYAAKMDALTKQYIGGIEAYKASIAAYGSVNDVTVKNADISSRVALASYEASLKLLETNARIAEINSQVQMEGLKAAASTASNLAAGALSGIHASVSDSWNNSAQNQYYYNMAEM
jgi:hypothetical protein